MILDEKLFEYKIAKKREKYAYDELVNKSFYVRADGDGKADYYIKTRYKEKADKAKKILDNYNLKYTEELYKDNYIIYFNEDIKMPETSYKKRRTQKLFVEDTNYDKQSSLELGLNNKYDSMSKYNKSKFNKSIRKDSEAIMSTTPLEGHKRVYHVFLDNQGRIENLKVKGQRGTWHEIDRMKVNGKMYYLLESEIWGDEANLLVITEDQSEVYQTFDDIETTLIDLDILEESLKEDKQDIDDKLDIEKEVKEIMSSADERHPYMMLGRLKSDCDYFLNYGNGNTKHLWAHNVKGQIDLMKGIWNALKDKPQWLTLEEIEKIGKNMLNYRKGLKEFKEVLKELEEIIKDKKEGSFEVNSADIKDFIVKELKDRGFEFEVSGNDLGSKNKFHVEYWKSLKENIETSINTLPEATKEEINTGIASIINSLIIDEWEAVDKYNSAIVTAQAEGFTEIGDVLFDILNEENTHIGQLQKCMEILSTTTNKIKEGEKEAEEQLEIPQADIEVSPEVMADTQEDII